MTVEEYRKTFHKLYEYTILTITYCTLLILLVMPKSSYCVQHLG
jgi:hypothetical protein